MAASECLLDEFQSRAAGCAQHNQFQALLVVPGSATARLGIFLHIRYI